MEREYKEVSKEEFLEFVKKWPNKLDWDVFGACEPPMGSYNDFIDGKAWPESMIAKIAMEWRGPDWPENREDTDESRFGKFWRYYILDVENYA